jgi:alkylation response protein AidB-like acyl-CoA dehydrogenase
VNGQKVWTTGAHYSKFGILIARTDPDAPKHKGITYFICPMDLPGIEIRTIKNIAGADSFNEVFFTDVRIPHDNVVGDVNDGWRLAKVTLGNERVSLSTGGVLWGNGPTALDVVNEARKLGPHSPVLRQELAQIYIEHTVLEIIRMRTLTARLRGAQPGPEASIRKIMADEHGQRVMSVARDIIGADALVIGPDDSVAGKHIRSKSWYSGYMFSQALTIGGGTTEVQKNILGERVLGLPAEPNPEKGLTWAESRRGG